MLEEASSFTFGSKSGQHSSWYWVCLYKEDTALIIFKPQTYIRIVYAFLQGLPQYQLIMSTTVKFPCYLTECNNNFVINESNLAHSLVPRIYFKFIWQELSPWFFFKLSDRRWIQRKYLVSSMYRLLGIYSSTFTTCTTCKTSTNQYEKIKIK